MDINLEYLIHNSDRFRDSYSKRRYGIIFLCYYNLFPFMSKLYAISIYFNYYDRSKCKMGIK